MFSKVSALALAGAVSLSALGAVRAQAQAQDEHPSPAQAQEAERPSGLTLVCNLTAGSRAGTSFYFQGTAANPARPGSGCVDMSTGSTGVAARPDISGQPSQNPPGQTPQSRRSESQGRYYQGQPGYSLPRGYSFVCRFTDGPRAGTTFDFTRTPGGSSARIGDGCTDGARSTGVAVAPSPSEREQERSGPY